MTEEQESQLISKTVEEFRTHNESWHKQGAVAFPATDLPGGVYLGDDKHLMQTCLEFRALIWKMQQLHLRSEFQLTPHNEAEWNAAQNDYFGFSALTEPLCDKRAHALAETRARTLLGLRAKASVLTDQYLNPPSDSEPIDSKLMRSVATDINFIIGWDS
jgi:hypothetical protein